MILCPCNSTKNYNECCGRYLDLDCAAPSPEALMRSRYTAYTLARIDYVAKTQMSPIADHFSFDETLAWAKRCKWLGLDVHRAWVDENSSTRGYVEFTAHFKNNGKKEVIHEISVFYLREGRWYYAHGK